MDAPTITSAALDTLAETGLDGLTMRAVAQRLGVRVGGLYYHIPDKAALLRAMADRLCHDALAAAEADPGPDRVAGLCSALRRLLRQYRDGARVLAAAPFSGSLEAFGLMERLLELLDGDVAPDRANVAADTLLSYTTGFALQEQVMTAPATFPPPDELAARFPRVLRGLGQDDDAAFATAVTAIVRGFAG